MLFSSPPWTPQPGPTAGARTQRAEAGPRGRPLSLYPPQPPALTQAHFSDKVLSPQQGHLQMPRREGKHPVSATPLLGTQVGLSHWLAVFPGNPHSPPTPLLQPKVLPSPSLRSLPPRRKVVGSLLRLAGPPLLVFLDTLSFLICFLYF